MKKKVFYCSNLAYYAKSIGRDEVVETMVGLFDADGGTHGEFAIRWANIGDNTVPQLQAYDDSWAALSEMPELIKVLAENDNKNLSQGEINSLLLSLGYEDTTSYTSPDGKDKEQIEKVELLNLKKHFLNELAKINNKLGEIK